MKWILESPKKPYFLEYRGDWKIKTIRKRDPEYLYTSAMHEYKAIDLSSIYSNWEKFVYINIPNNWLKMHGYPKHRRRKKL